MAVNKPTKPSVNLPDSFGGIKTPYNESQIRDGYLDGVPQTIDGGNINYEKDAIFKINKYYKAIADILVDLPIGSLLTVDENNRFIYKDMAKFDGLPPQAGQNGKYLQTNGSVASWQTLDVQKHVRAAELPAVPDDDTIYMIYE